MVEYSTLTSFKLTENTTAKNKKQTNKVVEPKKMQIPEPENFTMDYARNNHTFVSYIIKEPAIKIGTITGAKKYPCIKDSSGVVASGKPMALKFLKGLTHLGFGNVTPNEKNFKQFNFNSCNL